MTASEVAELLRLRESTVADLARREVLPSLRFGWARRFWPDVPVPDPGGGQYD